MVNDTLIYNLEDFLNYFMYNNKKDNWIVYSFESSIWKYKPDGVPKSGWLMEMLLIGHTLDVFVMWGDNGFIPFLINYDHVLEGYVEFSTELPHLSSLDRSKDFTYDALMQFIVYGRLRYSRGIHSISKGHIAQK